MRYGLFLLLFVVCKLNSFNRLLVFLWNEREKKKKWKREMVKGEREIEELKSILSIPKTGITPFWMRKTEESFNFYVQWIGGLFVSLLILYISKYISLKAM